MASGKQEGGNEVRDGEGPAAEAVAGLRSVVDQVSGVVRDLHAQDLRRQGERTVAGVSQQVEQNPLTSLAIAFALGYLVATLTRR